MTLVPNEHLRTLRYVFLRASPGVAFLSVKEPRRRTAVCVGALCRKFLDDNWLFASPGTP
jgi:hypothetical protein